MALIDLPPYVLAGESPPHHATEARGFHLRTWELPEPVAFPRELFDESLAVHARLLDEHGAEVLTAPLIDGGESEYLDPTDIGVACALLVSDGAAHEIHKWYREEASFVVQRCRGIVRQLMERTAPDRMYVVVVAAGAASLHLVRARSPRRVGDMPRLEVVGRALVVEPWVQWHRRAGRALITTWTTPAGDLAASRVAAPPSRWTIRAVVDALVHRYEPSAREGLAAYRAEKRGARPAVHVMSDVDGEEVQVVDRADSTFWAEGFPGIIRASRRDRPGFDPVMIETVFWGALAWLANGVADVAVPAVQYAWHEDAGPCPGPSVADLYHVPHRLKPGARRPPREEAGPEHWREMLAKSLSRLVRFADSDAPRRILEHERDFALTRIAKLEPADAEAVLRAWPRAARLLERGATSARPRPGREKPN